MTLGTVPKHSDFAWRSRLPLRHEHFSIEGFIVPEGRIWIFPHTCVAAKPDYSTSAAEQFAEKLCFWVAQRFTAAISRLF
jgi:hypothetical protein